ncbi:hypothetical protein WJX72_009650 [[Myrmecia] bisecta]|uniref:Amidase domain-containing protein n=1 Tax=[Myrmecia] bisecta TaxID=41462 RepID=A0AAW1QG48_9CHLO
MALPDLWRCSALEVVGLLRERKVTPLELIDVVELRVQATDGALNAIPTLCLDRARENARKFQAVNFANSSKPFFLHGLPIVVKDLTAVKGVRFTMGSLLFKDNVALYDDPLVETLKANGAIVIGKSNTPEFGAGANTYNAVFGETRNPWNTAWTPGGSSGGTAAAVAAGQVWLGTGTDLGGSLRTPASFTGLVGFRTTPGTVPQEYRPSHKDPAALQLESVSGPMARNVADLALMLDAMNQPHPRDPKSQLRQRCPSFQDAVQDALAGRANSRLRRIAWAPTLGGICQVDPEVQDICKRATDWFATLDGTSVHEACPDLHDAQRVFQGVRAACYATLKDMVREPSRSLINPDLLWQIEKGLAQTPEQTEAAEQGHAAYVSRVASFFQEYNLLCCPVVMVPPFDMKTRWVRRVQGKTGCQEYDNYVDWLTCTYAISLTNQPVLSVPCGVTAAGQPHGGRERRRKAVKKNSSSPKPTVGDSTWQLG